MDESGRNCAIGGLDMGCIKVLLGGSFDESEGPTSQ